MSLHGMSGRIAASEVVLVVALAVALIVSGGVLAVSLPWLLAGGIALVLLVLIWASWHGRYVTELLASRLRFRAGAPESVNSGDPLGPVLAGAEVVEHIDRAGNRFGLVGADGEWTAVVRLGQASTVDLRVVLTTLRAVYDRPDIPLRAASLTAWTVPGIPVREDVPAEPISVYWLAVRYSTSDAPNAALARGGEAVGARKATASAALGLLSALASAGISASVLPAGDLRSELGVALGVGPAGDAAGVREDWRELTVLRSRQCCFLPARRRDRYALLGVCVPAAEFTVSSYTVGRRYHGLAGEHIALRVGVAEDAEIPDVRAVGEHVGVRLVRCDGTHRKTAVRTLPLAAAFAR